MILDIETVLKDFKAVVQSINSDQRDTLQKVKEIIDDKFEELSNASKGTSGEKATKEEA